MKRKGNGQRKVREEGLIGGKRNGELTRLDKKESPAGDRKGKARRWGVQGVEREKR